MQPVTDTASKTRVFAVRASASVVLLILLVVVDPVLTRAPLWDVPVDRGVAFALALPAVFWLAVGLGPVAFSVWGLRLPVVAGWRSTVRSWAWLAATAFAPSMTWLLLLTDTDGAAPHGQPLLPPLAGVGLVYLLGDAITAGTRRRTKRQQS